MCSTIPPPQHVMAQEDMQMGQENIVRYWHAAELLQPQAAPELQKRDNNYASFIHDVTVAQLVTP